MAQAPRRRRPRRRPLSQFLPRPLIGYDRSMTATPQTRITVDEYLAWAAGQQGRHELYDGTVYAMSPEGAGHAKAKFAVQTALAAGIRTRGLPCHMMPDGMTVRIDARTAFEPDAL